VRVRNDARPPAARFHYRDSHRGKENGGSILIDVDSAVRKSVHVISPELASAQPANAAFFRQSHLQPRARSGAAAWGSRSTDAEHAMATGHAGCA